MGEKLLEVHNVSKTFPGVIALSNVDFALNKGEIHGLMGENGAGKSTLIKVITGVYTKDSGTIMLDGNEVHPTSPLHAEEMGISTVYQEVNLLNNLSVAENLAIGRRKKGKKGIDWKEMNRRAEEILSTFDIHIDVTELLGEYSIAIQQMVAIARALELDSKLLILDEPTSSLNADEVEKLFFQMRRLKNEGHAIIFVTHFLDQVFEITDRITVLRNGNYVGEYATSSMTKLDLVSKLMGKSLDDLKNFDSISSHIDSSQKETLVSVKGIGKSGYMNPFDLDVKKGDIVGLAGLLGSGRTEITNLLFGTQKPDTGSIELQGKPVAIHSPRKAIAHHVALSPEDRKEDGIIAGLSVRENIALALQVRRGWFKNLSTKKQTELAEKYIKMLSIKTSGVNQPIETLSGGNQQKVILARWLATDPDLLIVDEPTRGIDVGAKMEIQRLLVELSKEGMGVIFVSSEIEEVVRCSNRVYILQNRKIVGELKGDEISEKEIMVRIAAKEEGIA
ncbi:sugar ABC transporter ATP-binding protein [Pleomorphochaeta sp. DL1XJH-081]|uniref:sugar ABC transporter ATP-binding protein n=1 Tax=Pleomorphochaeta sp. DL1XJH-081 TaxID=3409690 RepID=UPI003BB66A69